MNPIGVMLNSVNRDIFVALPEAKRLGFEVIHTAALPERLLVEPERRRVIEAIRATGLRVDSMFVGFEGQSYLDWDSVARTVGLVQPEHRQSRLQTALRYVDIAAEVQATSLSLHLGFLPKNPSHPDYLGTVEAVRILCEDSLSHGLEVRLETGQETPEGLLAFMDAVPVPSLWINFDPGNFVIYGMADPLAALEKLWPRIRGFHCKDGRHPELPDGLGEETAPGLGDARLAEVLRRLLDLGFQGPIVIEREQRKDLEDVVAARRYINRITGR